MKAKKVEPTPAEKLQGLGRQCIRVWNWLQSHEEQVGKEAVAIGHVHYVTIKDIAAGLELSEGATAQAVISLAAAGLIGQITQDGRIAA